MIRIRNFEDTRLNSNEIPDTSHPYSADPVAAWSRPGGCDPALTSQVKVYQKALRALPNYTAGSAYTLT